MANGVLHILCIAYWYFGLTLTARIHHAHSRKLGANVFFERRARVRGEREGGKERVRDNERRWEGERDGEMVRESVSESVSEIKGPDSFTSWLN